MPDAIPQYAQQLAQSFRAARQRSAQSRLGEMRATEETVGVLRSVRKPFVIAYIFLAALALGLDALDFLETPTDATAIVFVVQFVLEVGFFLLIKAMIGRGAVTSLFLIACALFCMVTSAITAPIFIPLLLIFAFTNRQARVIQKSKEDLVGRMGSLDQDIAQYAARVEQLARTAARVSRGLGRVSKTVRRARIAGRIRLASQRITKASRTIRRAFGCTVGNIIPIIELAPFQLWTVYGTYKDQMSTWKEAQELLAEYEQKALERYQLEQEEAALQAAIAGEILSAHAAAEQEMAEQEGQAFERAAAQSPPAIGPPRTSPSIRDINPSVPVPAMG